MTFMPAKEIQVNAQEYSTTKVAMFASKDTTEMKKEKMDVPHAHVRPKSILCATEQLPIQKIVVITAQNAKAENKDLQNALEARTEFAVPANRVRTTSRFRANAEQAIRRSALSASLARSVSLFCESAARAIRLNVRPAKRVRWRQTLVQSVSSEKENVGTSTNKNKPVSYRN